MDEKARLLLKDLKQFLKTGLASKKEQRAVQLMRISEYLHVLLRGCEAKLFSKACVRDLLGGVEWVVSELHHQAIGLEFLRPVMEQAVKVARSYSQSGIEKTFAELLPTVFSTERAGTLSLVLEADMGQISSETLTSPRDISWHRPYLKVLLRLLEQQNQGSEKKLPFQALLEEALTVFLGVLKDPRTSLDAGTQRAMIGLIQTMVKQHGLVSLLPALNVQEAGLALLPLTEPSSAAMCRLPLTLLGFFQTEILRKEPIQTLLSVTQSFAEECLRCHENSAAYALLDKAIVLADQANLARSKVTMTLLQGEIFSGGSSAKTQRELITPEKVQTLLNNYFDALPVAEAGEDLVACEKLYHAITVLEKQFLYQTMAPWIVFSMSQAVESGVKETFDLKWARFQEFSQALLACRLPELAWDCAYQCQSALTFTEDLKALHRSIFETLAEISTQWMNPTATVLATALAVELVTGEWQQARQQLVTYRKILERGIKDPSQFRESQCAYTENMQGLVVRFFKEAEAWLGVPPEPYAVLGLGSISRKTMSPYSDFECVFLVSDAASADWEGRPNESAKYFDALYQIFEFKMASLGELRGFRLDKEGHPRKELRLRGTPAQVIHASKPPQAPLDNEMTYSLVQSCFVHGDEELWKTYQIQFIEALAEPVRKNDPTPWGMLLATSFAKFHIKSIKTDLPDGKKTAMSLKPTITTTRKEEKGSTEDEPSVGMNVKKKVVNHLFYLLTDVTFSHQYFFTDPSTALEKLVAENHLSATFASAYRNAMQIADRIRVRLHLHYKEQQDVALLPNDNLSLNPSLIALTAQEYAQLQCIEWGVLHPMEQALLRWQNGYPSALYHPTQDLLDIVLLKSQEASDNRPIFSVEQRDVMRNLVAMLWLAGAQPDEYRRQYLALPNTAIRQLFLEQLTNFKSYYEFSAWQDIQAYLEDAPYRDGSRDMERSALAAFESQLASLVVPGSKNSNPTLEWIQADGTRKSGSLHPEVIKVLQEGKLLDSKGKFQLLEKHVNLPGRHLVFPLDLRIGQQSVALHVKFFPEMPGMEYAAGCLARLLVGWGAPYVQLARLVDGNKVYPILLSQTISGELLSDLLKKNDANQLYEKLDHKRYSQRVLLSLLLNQEDAKPSNFIAVAHHSSTGNIRYSLFCIDNDRSFFQAVMEENGQIVPIVKDMTYCFEAMYRPLDPVVCVDALFVDPFRLLRKWLGTLETFNRHLAQLFTDGDIEKLFPKNQSVQPLQQLRQNLGTKEAVKESILPIVLREQVASDLFIKMVRIQQYLRKNSQATGYELLRHVEPYLSKYYGNLLRYYPQIDARFQKGFAQLYSEKKDKRGTQQTLKTAFATLQTFHGKPVDSQAFLERKKVFIEDAIKELSCAFDRQHTWESVYEKLQKGIFEGLTDFVHLPDHYLRSKIINQLDFSKLSPEFEKAFWDQVLPLKIPFQKLTLKHSRIDSVQFDLLLQAMTELRLLHLEDCQNLGPNFIGTVAQYCPILEKLWLSRLPFVVIDNRQSFIRQLFTPPGAKASGVFEELRYLSIRDCGSLSEIYIQAPALTHVEICECPQFLKGLFNSVVLREVKLNNIPRLTQTALSQLVHQADRLKVLNARGCPLLKALPFYERFPYLLPVDVTVFSNRWLNQFFQLLEPYEPKKLDDVQVVALVAALKRYALQIEQFKNSLFESLKEASMDVNVSALLTLGQLGYCDDGVNTILQTQLKNSNQRFRQAAAIAMVCLKPDSVSSDIIALVEAALSSPDKNLAQAAMRALIWVPERTEKLAMDFCQPLPSVTSDAKRCQAILSILSEVRVAIPSVITLIGPLLSDKDSLTQAYVLYVWGRMGVLDKQISQHLSYFQTLGRDSLRFGYILSELNRWERGIGRQFQLLMLPLCKSLPSLPLPSELIKQAKDTRWEQRKQAIVQLRDLRVDTKEIRGILYEATRDLSHQVRQLAIEVLASFTHVDPLTVPAFAQALQDKERVVCEAGIQAFGRHPETFSVGMFVTMQALITNESATSTRKIFAQTLSHLSQHFPETFDHLLTLVKDDKYTEVKQAAMESLLTWLSFNQLSAYLEEVSGVKMEAAKLPRVQKEAVSSTNVREKSTYQTTTTTVQTTSQTTTTTTTQTTALSPSTPSASGLSDSGQDDAPSVLFPKNFRYLEVLRRFRQTLWDAISAVNPPSDSALLTRLLAETTTPLLKAVLLEAFEWIPLKLAVEQEALEHVRLQLTLAERVLSWEKKVKFSEPLFQSLLTDLQLFLQKQVADMTDPDLRRQLQEVSDRIRVLRTVFSPAHVAALQKDEHLAFKQVTVRQVMEVTGQKPFDTSFAFIHELKKVRAKKIWKPLVQFLNEYLPTASLKVRQTELASRCQQLKQRYQRLLTAFKAQLQLVSTSRWKPQWLYGKSVAPERSGGKKGVLITSFFHVNQSLLPERWVCFDGLSGEVSSLLGSTYFGAEKPQMKETTLCMDANYQQGHTGATSDGYGHFTDAEFNRSIQQAAYRTVKLATRYADFYLRAEDLFSDLPRLFQHLGQAVKQSNLHPEASGTASCVLTKVFTHTSDPTLCTVVAAGVGDGMALVWDPKSQRLEVLVKPRQYDRGLQFTPVSVTEPIKGDMLQCVMKSIPSGAFVMRLTDGAWQALPHRCSGTVLDPSNQKRYLEYTLDIAALMPELTLFMTKYPKADAKAYRECLMQWIQKSVHQKKAFLLEETNRIRGKIDRFGQKTTAKVENFLKWVEQTEPSYSKTLLKFLDELHVAVDTVKSAPLSDFVHQLDKIHLGDDVALHVEQVGETVTVTSGMGLRM